MTTTTASSPAAGLRSRHASMARQWDQQLLKGGYRAATSSRLRQKHASGSAVSGDHVNERDRETLIEFSRGLDQGTIVYRPFVRQVANLIVGPGLWPRASANSPAGRAVELFRRWGKDPSLCDARGQLTWPSMLRAIVTDAAVAGDVLVVRTESGTLQLVEAERVGLTMTRRMATDTQPQIIEGVEMAPSGRPLAYHVRDWGPTGSSLSAEATRVDAAACSLFAFRDRLGTARGVPLLAPALETLCILDETKISLCVQTQISSMFAVAVQSKSPAQAREQIVSGTQTSGGAGDDGGSSSVVRSLAGVQPGVLMFLEPDESIQAVQGAAPPANYAEFERGAMRLIAAMVGVPLEVALLDNSNVNFSTARMAELQAANTAEPAREQLVACVCQPVFRWLVARAMIAGILPAPDDDAGRAAMFEAYTAVTWPNPPRRVLDRTKELAADEAALRLRLKAKDDIILESGDDPEQVRADIAREIAEEKRLGIDGVVPTFGSTGSPPAPSQDQAPVTREPAAGDAAPIGDA